MEINERSNMSRTLYEIAQDNEWELPKEEYDRLIAYKRRAYDVLIELVDGETIGEREENMNKLSYLEKVKMVEDYENSHDNEISNQ